MPVRWIDFHDRTGRVLSPISCRPERLLREPLLEPRQDESRPIPFPTVARRDANTMPLARDFDAEIQLIPHGSTPLIVLPCAKLDCGIPAMRVAHERSKTHATGSSLARARLCLRAVGDLHLGRSGDWVLPLPFAASRARDLSSSIAGPPSGSGLRTERSRVVDDACRRHQRVGRSDDPIARGGTGREPGQPDRGERR